MSRLTKKHHDGIANIVDTFSIKEINCCDSTMTNWESAYTGEPIDKLSEYEDIGLTPDEIKHFLKDFGFTVAMRNRKLIKELQEYRNLEMEGRLIKLSCKVGDTVYESNINRNIISSYKVTSIVVMTGSKNYNWELVEGTYSNLNGFNEFALGKTIFLTREEAEKALKESVE